MMEVAKTILFYVLCTLITLGTAACIFVLLGPIRWYRRELRRIESGLDMRPEPKWLKIANRIAFGGE